ncbi:tRNA preQ1(34) S-adenosylmethionine ribosyltransferase-isomerase QueA [Oceanivirga salmonicida]|uniref:tRNA preQ1(34) S-adenosylmethionine ribosyltransferase-isomerase QueA n=1 Tax=Oceanivirga salmonicida TaxID=1769291 RepID=UPI0008313758|nr:tRNA preQ1(34) S-adenosylmethionine ribosyltransferase-isomerase QueA [Oceanivirga salmonicida]
MNIKEFDFELPEKLIAQNAVEPRDHSKLLAVNKNSGKIEHKRFYNILDYLKKDDVLVINRTKVIPARLIGHKKNGVVIECLLLKRLSLNTWEVLLKPAKRLKIGDELIFLENKLSLKLLEIKDDGNRIVEFIYKGAFEAILDELGELPLPPYIHEKLKDKNRYQTVYAKNGESVAAPTAGLHFTNELLDRIRDKGITIAEVYLTVGLGTFRPVKVENVEEHIMHSEEYYIPNETADIINKAKSEGRRIVAVGTTSVRTLESSLDKDNKLIAKKDSTDIFIYGEYDFKIVDAVITNFHLPKSTLVMLISSFMGSKERLMNAYKVAIENEYRFFSLGDSMYIGENV